MKLGWPLGYYTLGYYWGLKWDNGKEYGNYYLEGKLKSQCASLRSLCISSSCAGGAGEALDEEDALRTRYWA